MISPLLVSLIVIAVLLVLLTQHLTHVRPVQEVAESFVIRPHANTRDDRDLATAVLIPSDALCFLHQQGAVSSMLEFALVPAMYRHGETVDMQLSHQTSLLPRQLLPERVFLTTLPQPQQRDQDILPRILVREKRLPAAIRDVVPSDQLDLVGPDLVLHLVDPDFSCAHVAAGRPEVLHARESELAEVAVLDAGRDERHGDVALDAVDAGPGRDEGHDSCDQVDQRVRRVVLVAARAPELVQPRAADDERGVDLQAVGAEGGVGKVLFELREVALEADVGEIGHHVADDFETGVFGLAEGGRDGGDGVPAVGVARDVLVEGLDADFEARAAVAQHGGEVGGGAVVRAGFDGDANALDGRLLGGGDGFGDVVGRVAREGVVELGDEFVAVGLRQGHEGAAHDDVFDFVDGVAEGLDLLDAAARLLEGVVAGSDGAH